MRNTRSCRAELPVPVWEELSRLAAESGVPLGTYARRVLTAHALGEQPEVSGTPDTGAGPSPEQWQQVVQWVRTNPGRWAEYTGPRDVKNPADRAAVWAWHQQVSGNG